MTIRNLSILAMFLVFISGARSQSQVLEAGKDESSVTYRLVHPLHEIEATSKEVAFKLEVDPPKKEIKSVSAQVDVTTFDSGNSNRDSHAMEVIDGITYPDVTFSSTEITQTGDSLQVAGKLTFHGVTNDISATAIANWTEQKIDVQARFFLSLTAFKIERPSLLLIPVNDTLWFTLKAAFNRN
ncbi:MAG: YceI family protein [Bacteroidota bacterium]